MRGIERIHPHLNPLPISFRKSKTLSEPLRWLPAGGSERYTAPIRNKSMVATDRVREIFADARALHESALDQLRAGDIRDAAEKAWCATRRASDALILARTQSEPEKTPETSRTLRNLGLEDPEIRPLVNRYLAARDALHGDCFYLGLCEPIEDTTQRIPGDHHLH